MFNYFQRLNLIYIYMYIYGTPPQDPPLTSLTPIQLAMALQCHCKLDGFKIQDSRFLRTLSSKSWIQDSRFKIPRDSFEQILNPNLESNPWIQDSRFLGTLSSKSWIQDSRFKIPRDSLQEILNPGFKMDSRFAPKSSWESWILNLESSGWIQDLLQRVPGNLESWNLGLKNGPKIYWIGTSNQSVPEMAIEKLVQHSVSWVLCSINVGWNLFFVPESWPLIYVWLKLSIIDHPNGGYPHDLGTT